MWTIVHPMLSQCCKSLKASKGPLIGTGAAFLGSTQLLRLPRKSGPLVLIPLKDYEVIALQQLTS